MGGSQRVGGSDEERPINTPNLRAGLADRLFMPPIVSRLTANAPVQRLVVNTGEDSFHDEVSGERGWIVAKDIDVALQHGGVGQKIVEADALGTADPIGGSENIYLEGHGSPDFLGDKDPEDVADALRPVLPDPYVGTIYSLSCSAGVASEPDSFSGIEMLARELGLATRMEGAAGVALNHPALPGSHRAIRSGNFDAADLIIDKKITGYDINRMWSDYIEKVWTGSLPLAAAVATDMTEAFYVDVAETLDTLGYLLPTNADTMVVEDAEGYGEIGEGSLEHEDQAPDTSNPFSVLVRGKD